MLVTVYCIQNPVGDDGKFIEIGKFFNESDALSHAKKFSGSKVVAREESSEQQHPAHQASVGTVSAWGQPLQAKPGLVRA